MYRQISLT